MMIAVATSSSHRRSNNTSNNIGSSGSNHGINGASQSPGLRSIGYNNDIGVDVLCGLSSCKSCTGGSDMCLPLGC